MGKVVAEDVSLRRVFPGEHAYGMHDDAAT
jgi:hypothetical protein